MIKKTIKGNNSHGFKNEESIVENINKKKYSSLPLHFKKFLKEITQKYNLKISDNSIINIEKSKPKIDPTTNRKINPKPDFYFIFDNKKIGVSTKIGNGNSVHQEKAESFIDWISSNNRLKLDDKNICNNLRILAWCDGTLDGSAKIEFDSDGNIKNRFTTKEFKKRYYDLWFNIQKFLNLNNEEIIKRVLFLGKTNDEVHYIYYGTYNFGLWASQEDILKLNLEKPLKTGTFNVGRISFQIYNADKKGTISGSKKRGIFQFKYTKIKSDIENILYKNTNNSGTYEGDLEECNISRYLNKNTNSNLWKILREKLKLNEKDFIYAIKVNGCKFSKNINKNVKCKTDIFLIKTEVPISKDVLLVNNHQLYEKQLKEINVNYQIVKDSGISVKIKGSNRYTITKMTCNSFVNAFESYLKNSIYYFCAITLYCEGDKVIRNDVICKSLKINDQQFVDFLIKNTT